MDTMVPEHDKRCVEDGLHPDVEAAYTYVESIIPTADRWNGEAPMWNGWALREAFLAGITHAENKQYEAK